MRVTREKSAGALFILFMQVGSNSPRGKVTVDLTQVQAISRPDVSGAMVRLLVSGAWVHGLLVEDEFSHPPGLTIDEDTKAKMKAVWLKRVDHAYDALGEAWAAALAPLYKMEVPGGREYRGK
jgi:uncharacterized protein HemX